MNTTNDKILQQEKKSLITHPDTKKKKHVLVAGQEMAAIYEALYEIDEEEIRAAINQKNILKKEHIFDVIATRKKITYRDIYLKIKEICEPLIGEKKILFEELASDVRFENNQAYLLYGELRKKRKKRVNLAYLPDMEQIEKSKIPTLILPKDQYHIAFSRQSVDSSFSSVSHNNFTFLSILEEAISKDVSDIHVTYSENYYYISFRQDGDLVYQSKYLLSKKEGDMFLRKIKQEAATFTKGAFNADEHNLPQDARLEYPKLKADVRLSFIPRGTLSGENAMTARILRQQQLTKEDFSFKEKGYDQDFINLMNQATRLSGGLMLVAGITGSGKSTLLSHFTVQLPHNKRIITFEDPIEFKMVGSHITQHQRYIPSDKSISFDFSDGVKQAKRSDPDIFYIGEIRKDKDNTDLIDSVIEASQAGQYVLSTLHVNSAFGIYKAMNSIFKIDVETLSGLLLLTINQVLVKTLCPYCKIEDTEEINRKRLRESNEQGMIRYAYKKDLERFLSDTTRTYIRNKKGCPHCNYSGTLGRKPIYEFLKPDVEMIQWIAKGNIERFAIEEKACSQRKTHLAKNKLTNYIEAIERGEVDTHSDVMDKIIL
ncbi:MAG TPA: hypothetical protein ENN12_03865 [Epsilonproteobacteria bacterium]|nr:hypothetical protein [Campylobacterota bacterium]